MNCLQNKLTRYTVFNAINKLKCDVVLLQEILFTDNIVNENEGHRPGKLIYALCKNKFKSYTYVN